MAKTKHVIGVISGKGGVGKSTLAVNIASLLSRNGIPTILLDADFYNPCVFFHLGLSPHPSGFQELLEGRARVEDVLSIHPLTGLRCISASLQFYKNVRTKNLQKIVDSLDYDFVIIDCAPGLSELVEDVIRVSNEIFLMMTPDIPSATAAIKLMSKLGQEQRIKKIHFVLNRVSNQPYELHPREIEDICKSVAPPLVCHLSVVIPEDVNVPRSIALKSPVVLSMPNSLASRIFQKLAQNVLSENGLHDGPPFFAPASGSAASAPSAFFDRLRYHLRGLFRFK